MENRKCAISEAVLDGNGVREVMLAQDSYCSNEISGLFECLAASGRAVYLWYADDHSTSILAETSAYARTWRQSL